MSVNTCGWWYNVLKHMSDYKIFHEWMKTTNPDLVKQIDENGGWPVHANSLVMRHTGVGGQRPCYFSELVYVGNEWNTPILTKDEYYWLKVSDDKKKKFESELRRKIAKEIL